MADVAEIRDAAARQLPYALGSVNVPELKLGRALGRAAGGGFYPGKVRDSYRLPDGRILLVTTDRVSAFDHVLGVVPFKGAVLNGISTHFLAETADVFPNALLETAGSHGVVMRDLRVLPVEAIVRAYITGSAARDYFDRKQTHKCGIDISRYLREGRRNERFTELLFTPSTKSDQHDEDITEEEMVSRGLVTAEQRERIRSGSLDVFRRGEQLARGRGLILVDTKFEYGVDESGNIMLVDEVLTPDSSRYWIATSYEERYERDEEPEGLSKEPLRQALIERVATRLRVEPKELGKMLPGLPRQIFMDAMDDELRVETAVRYIQLYQQVTGRDLDLAVGDPRPEIYRALKASGQIKGYFVAVIAGSPGDDDHVKKIREELDKRGIPNEHRVCSAHKDPERLASEVAADYENSIEPVVYVTVAGMSNGLSGTLAANTHWPVIACPPYGDKFGGADVFSTLRMPSGTPVLTVLEPANVASAAQRMFGLFDSGSRHAASKEIDGNRRKGREADDARRGRALATP